MDLKVSRGLNPLRTLCLGLSLLSMAAAVWPARSQLLFGHPTYFPTGHHPIAIASGDFNADQIPDLVTVHANDLAVAILLGTGGGSFAAPESISMVATQHAVACADLNGDGIPDLAVTIGGMAGRVCVMPGVGDGSFGPVQPYAVGAEPMSVAIGDLNRDGIPDLAVADEISSNVAVLLGAGDGTFGPASYYASGSMPMSVAIGDLNGDQIPDLATADRNADRVGVLLGIGDGSFAPPVLYPTGDDPFSLVVGDFDGDDAPDLATANPGQAGPDDVGVLLGHGDGTFAPVVLYDVGDGPMSIISADINSDGVLDLVVSEKYWDAVAVLLGRGDGTFYLPRHYAAGEAPVSVAIGDLDGDQILDLAVADEYADNVAVLLGLPAGAGLDLELHWPPLADLLAVCPDPVVSRTAIEFDLHEGARARLQILDVSGRVVGSLCDRYYPAGHHNVVWNATSSPTATIRAGTYYLILSDGRRTTSRTITLVR